MTFSSRVTDANRPEPDTDPQRIGERGRSGAVGVREHGQEAVAAGAPERVGLAHPQAHAERDLAQDRVAAGDP